PTPTPTGGGSCTAQAWNSGTAYVGGTTVSYNGHQYTSKWWTQGEQPDTHSGPNDVWVDKGACSGGTPTPSPTTKSPSPTTTPSKSPTPTPTPTGTGHYAAWVANHAYAVGDRVTYAGHDY